MRYERIRTADEREMRRLVRRGALVMAEYNWQGSGMPELEQRGREWVLMLPAAESAEKAA